ncbi:hypothetical protein BC830DRAFT_1195127 [Chytriomyces sp. MP71]|nr:hypothetical protein BC830DRAFT_1195127 [Chytriomyces sp. MP71]
MYHMLCNLAMACADEHGLSALKAHDGIRMMYSALQDTDPWVKAFLNHPNERASDVHVLIMTHFIPVGVSIDMHFCKKFLVLTKQMMTHCNERQYEMRLRDRPDHLDTEAYIEPGVEGGQLAHVAYLSYALKAQVHVKTTGDTTFLQQLQCDTFADYASERCDSMNQHQLLWTQRYENHKELLNWIPDESKEQNMLLLFQEGVMAVGTGLRKYYALQNLDPHMQDISNHVAELYHVMAMEAKVVQKQLNNLVVHAKHEDPADAARVLAGLMDEWNLTANTSCKMATEALNLLRTFDVLLARALPRAVENPGVYLAVRWQILNRGDERRVAAMRVREFVIDMLIEHVAGGDARAHISTWTLDSEKSVDWTKVMNGLAREPMSAATRAAWIWVKKTPYEADWHTCLPKNHMPSQLKDESDQHFHERVNHTHAIKMLHKFLDMSGLPMKSKKKQARASDRVKTQRTLIKRLAALKCVVKADHVFDILKMECLEGLLEKMETCISDARAVTKKSMDKSLLDIMAAVEDQDNDHV